MLIFLLSFIPLTTPVKRNIIIIVIVSTLITVANGLLILNLGINFYIDYYIYTLTIPYILLFYFFAVYKGSMLVFALLTIQTIANVAILNGLLASYVIFKEDSPYLDIVVRMITYLALFKVLIKYIKPTYLKMVLMLKKEWWILNLTLILSYGLTYTLLFIPDAIFNRPAYFIHAYIGMSLTLVIYFVMFIFFGEVKLKTDIEIDKQLLYQQVTYLSKESEKITNIAYVDALTGVKNRYSLFRKMDQLIVNKVNFLVVFIDLDNFKDINDEYDHTTGDMYLKMFAKKLEILLDNKGLVYRFAGDEFVCLITENIDSFDQSYLKENIINITQMDIPFYGFSQGVAYYPNDGLNADDLINHADQMMYTEKKLKRLIR